MTEKKDKSMHSIDHPIHVKINPNQILTLQVANCPNIDREIIPIHILLSLFGRNKLNRVFSVGEDFQDPSISCWFQKQIAISLMEALKENEMEKGWYFVQGKGSKYSLKNGDYDHFWLEYEDWEIVFPDHIQYIRNEKHFRISVSNSGYYLSDKCIKMVKRICFPGLDKVIGSLEKENYTPGRGFEQFLGTLEE